MTRRHVMPPLFGWMMTLLASGVARAADPACVYQSRSYSEGAYICVQRSLMQTCTSDGARMVWRVIADGELNARCTAPLTFAEPRRRLVHRARPVRHAVAPAPAESVSAKCFVFNGKRYCE
jgi:hypothetical protein